MLFRVGELPREPLDAGAWFYAEVLPAIEAQLGQDAAELVLVFGPADHRHRAWRLAVVQELARKRAPLRVNAVVSDEVAAIGAAERYLASAPGVTGQLLMLDGNGAE